MEQQFLKQVKITVLDNGQVAGTSTVTGTALDMQGYDGVTFLSTIPVANAGNFFKASDGDTSGGGFNDIAGSKVVADANNSLVALDIYKPAKRFIKPILVRAGASTLSPPLIAIQYNGRIRPLDNNVANVAKAVSLVSPADGTA